MKVRALARSSELLPLDLAPANMFFGFRAYYGLTNFKMRLLSGFVDFLFYFLDTQNS